MHKRGRERETDRQEENRDREREGGREGGREGESHFLHLFFSSRVFLVCNLLGTWTCGSCPQILLSLQSVRQLLYHRLSDN